MTIFVRSLLFDQPPLVQLFTSSYNSGRLVLDHTVQVLRVESIFAVTIGISFGVVIARPSMSNIRSLTILCGLMTMTHVGLGQVPFAGPCPLNVTVVNNFQETQYLGKWYENQKYPFIFEKLGKCIVAEYALKDANTIAVHNSQINRINGQREDAYADAKIVAPAKLNVQFQGMPSFGGSNYWILDTDYTNYAVVYSCIDLASIANAKIIWILTRQRHADPAVVHKARDAIDQQGLSLKELQITDQTDCPIE